MNEVDEQTGDNNRLSSSVVSAPRQAEGGAGPWRPVWVRGFRTFRRRRWAGGPSVPDADATRAQGRLLDGPGSIERRTALSAQHSPGRAVRTTGDAALSRPEAGRGQG